MDLSFLGSAAGSVASGGLTAILGPLTGLFGGWLKNKHDLKVRALDDARADKERAHDLALMSKEAEVANGIASMKLDETMFKYDSKLLGTAIAGQEATVTWSDSVMGKTNKYVANFLALVLGFITFVQKMLRPGLTIYLLILVHSLWSDMNVIMDTNNFYMTAEQAFTIVSRISNMVLYLSSTSVTFWFATRPPKIKS